MSRSFALLVPLDSSRRCSCSSRPSLGRSSGSSTARSSGSSAIRYAARRHRSGLELGLALACRPHWPVHSPLRDPRQIDSVLAVKEKLTYKNVARPAQKLLFSGRVLADTVTLGEAGIKPRNFLVVIVSSGASSMEEEPNSVQEELMDFLSMQEELMAFLSIQGGFDVFSTPWGFGAQLCSLRHGSKLRDANECRLAVLTALATTGIPLELQQQLGRDLDTRSRSPRVLHTLAVLARDLASDDRSSTPSKLFVSHVLLRGRLPRATSEQHVNQSDMVGKMQRHLEGLRKADWRLLAPLLRKVLRHPIEPPPGWIYLLLRAIDAPALGILRKQDALVLAKGLLKARCGELKIGVESDLTAPLPGVESGLTALLGAMERAHGLDEPTRAVLRVVAFFTTSNARLSYPPDLELLHLVLPGHCHVPPPCSPMFEPLTADLPATSEFGALLVERLAQLGTDALSLTLLRRMTLRGKRAAACSCRGLRTLIAPHLRSATLHVLAEDATLDNAAFVARLPTLERLHVEGESFLCDGLDIPKLRSLPRLALKTIGAPAALFLGYLLRGGEHTIRLSNGSSCISLQPVATRDSLSLFVTSAADLAVVLGPLSNNRALKRLALPLIFGQNERSKMAAVDELDEMVVQLGQALRYAEDPCVDAQTQTDGSGHAGDAQACSS